MLAYKVDKKPINWTEKVYMQTKLNGVRCLIQINDKEEERLMYIAKNAVNSFDALEVFYKEGI